MEEYGVGERNSAPDDTSDINVIETRDSVQDAGLNFEPFEHIPNPAAEEIIAKMHILLLIAEDNRNEGEILHIADSMLDIDPFCSDALFWKGGSQFDSSDLIGGLESWDRAIPDMSRRYVEDYADIMLETIADCC